MRLWRWTGGLLLVIACVLVTIGPITLMVTQVVVYVCTLGLFVSVLGARWIVPLMNRRR
ncbi:hypothetical protein ACWGII_13950 [Streptomyces sp. NPDC054855]